jgi:hypothetical protein
MHKRPFFKTPPPDESQPTASASEIAHARLKQFCLRAASTRWGFDEPPAPDTGASTRPADPDLTAWN